jgi:hypothetical protein
MTLRPFLVGALAFIALAGFLAWPKDDSHILRNLPMGIDSTGVLWSREEVHGFGPGSNETGFSVIALSETSAAQVAIEGIQRLDRLTEGRLAGDWMETPVPGDDLWQGREDSALGRYSAPTVEAVLNRYGFGFQLPDEYRVALDRALNAPGSYYAFGPGGLVVVIVPATQRAYVIYAG